MHLNPVRVNLLAPDDRLLAYPWSSFPLYLADRRYRPQWLRADRLLGEHGIQQDMLWPVNGKLEMGDGKWPDYSDGGSTFLFVFVRSAALYMMKGA